MITIVMGAPGTGKSTFLALQALKQIKKGKNVWSNYYIEGCKKLDCDEDLGKSHIENGTLIIDEGGREHNARDFRNFTKNQYDFYTQHRHYKINDIFLAVQFWDRVDITIRELVQEIIILEPTIFPKFIRLRKVNVQIGIPKDEYTIQEMFTYRFLGTRYYYAPPAWSLYNSWEKDLDLYKKEWSLWNEYIQPPKIYKRLKNKYKDLKNKFIKAKIFSIIFRSLEGKKDTDI